MYYPRSSTLSHVCHALYGLFKCQHVFLRPKCAMMVSYLTRVPYPSHLLPCAADPWLTRPVLNKGLGLRTHRTVDSAIGVVLLPSTSSDTHPQGFF